MHSLPPNVENAAKICFPACSVAPCPSVPSAALAAHTQGWCRQCNGHCSLGAQPLPTMPQLWLLWFLYKTFGAHICPLQLGKSFQWGSAGLLCCLPSHCLSNSLCAVNTGIKFLVWGDMHPSVWPVLFCAPLWPSPRWMLHLFWPKSNPLTDLQAGACTFEQTFLCCLSRS